MWKLLIECHFTMLPNLMILFLFYHSCFAFGSGGHGHGSDDNHDENDGLVRISDVGLETSRIDVKVAKKEGLQLSLEVNGYIIPNPYHTSNLRPRYPGVVKKVHVKLGQRVKKGQKLATVQANGSETNFDIVASFPGVIFEKDLVIGQFVSVSHEMFKVSNLSSVWAELSIPENFVQRIRKGMKTTVRNWDGDASFTGSISYLSSIIYEDSQSIMARVVIDNKTANWRPGVFVKAVVFIESLADVISVNKSAIQTLEGKRVVFIEQSEGVFIPQPVELGRSNTNRVEVVSGIKLGDRYVVSNSYILKADFLKSEASHEH